MSPPNTKKAHQSLVRRNALMQQSSLFAASYTLMIQHKRYNWQA